MKKILVVLFFLLHAGLIATDDKKSDTDKKPDIVIQETSSDQSRHEWPNRSRSLSLSYVNSIDFDNESSDDESSDEELSSDNESDEVVKTSRKHIMGLLLEKRVFERLMPYGGHIFGGMMAVLIAYKFYRAGYL